MSTTDKTVMKEFPAHLQFQNSLVVTATAYANPNWSN